MSDYKLATVNDFIRRGGLQRDLINGLSTDEAYNLIVTVTAIERKVGLR